MLNISKKKFGGLGFEFKDRKLKKLYFIRLLKILKSEDILQPKYHFTLKSVILVLCRLAISEYSTVGKNNDMW